MKKKIKLIFVLVLVIVLVFVMNERKTNKEENIDKGNELIFGQYSEETVDSLTETEKNEWIGEYELGESLIQVCRIDEKACDLMVFADGQISKDVVYFDSDNKLSCKGEFLNETYNIVLKKDGDKISVDANSSDVNSIYNQIDGVYVKKAKEDLGWNGVYESGDVTITISEISNNKTYLYINKNETVIGKNISNCTIEKLILNENKSNEEVNIEVEKIQDGISIKANSTNKTSVLNEVMGEYKKL